MSVNPFLVSRENDEPDKRIAIFVIVGLSIILLIGLLISAAIYWIRPFNYGLQGREVPVPPEPRLQINEVGDLRSYTQQQEQILNNYGPSQTDKVRVPVERAMKLIEEQGVEESF